MLPRIVVPASIVMLFTLTLQLAVGNDGQVDARLTDEAKEQLIQQRDVLVEQALKLFAEGQLKESLDVRERILVIERRVFGNVHTEVVGSLTRMAAISESLRDFVRAAALRREAAKVYSELHGESSREAANERRQAQYADLRAGMNKADLDDLDYAAGQLKAAFRSFSQARTLEALALARETVGIRTRLLGAEHYILADSLLAVGRFSHVAGRLEDAREAYEKGLAVCQKQLGIDRLTAIALNNLGAVLEDLSDVAGSEVYYRKSLAMRRQLYPREKYPRSHAAIATALSNLGLVLAERNKLEEARASFEESIAILRTIYGDYPVEQYPDNYAGLATSLNNLGSLNITQGNYADARKQLEESLALRRQIYSPEKFPDGHPALATAITNFGQFLRRIARFDESRKYSEEGLQSYRRLYPPAKYPDGHVELANALILAGGVSRDVGDLAAALSYYREALLMLQNVLPESVVQRGHPKLVIILNAMLQIHDLRGEYSEARAFSEQVLNMVESLYPKNEFPNGHLTLAETLLGIGGMLTAHRNYDEAYEHSSRALQIFERLFPTAKYPAGHRLMVDALSQLGVILENNGQAERAEACLKRALDMTSRLDEQGGGRVKHLKLARAKLLNNLSFHYLHKSDFVENERCLREAVVIMREHFADDDTPRGQPLLAQYLGNLGRGLTARGDYEGALESLASASVTLEQLYPLELYPSGTLDLVNCEFLQAHTLFAKGDYVNALTKVVRALDMQQKLALTFAASAAEMESVNLIQHSYNVRDLWLSLCLVEDRPSKEIYGKLWQNRRLVHRLMSARQRMLMINPPEQVASDYREYLSIRQEFSQLALAPMSKFPDAAMRRRERLSVLGRRKEQLERSLADSLPAFARQQKVERSTLSDLLDGLPSDAIFIDIVKFGRFDSRSKEDLPSSYEYLAFVVGAQEVAAVPLGNVLEIDAALHAWRKQLVGASTQHDAGLMNSAAQTVRKFVWGKLSPHVPAQTRNVFICADGDLSELPWGALPDRQDESVLLQRYGFVLVPHGQFLSEQLQSVRPSTTATKYTHLLISDVDYDGEVEQSQVQAKARMRAVREHQGMVRWDLLPATKVEGEAVLGLLQNQEVEHLTGAAATTSEVLRKLPTVSRAHVATHGFFADDRFRQDLRLDPDVFGSDALQAKMTRNNPLILSGIVLAGANRPLPTDELGIPTGDGGILTAEAIAGLPLQDLDLVTLSACETGMGVGNREQLYGLQRAFHLAGTSTVVSSLWKVDDKATQQLMLRFYENLYTKKMSKLDALRHAQLSFLYGTTEFSLARSLRRKEASPATRTSVSTMPLWGAWTISGDWR